MTFVARAAIALLAGVGAGLIGFWATWHSVWTFAGQHPGIGYDGWLLAGIFVPGVGATLAVFQTITRASTPMSADGQPS